MYFEIRHFIPGRIRLYLPSLPDGDEVADLIKFTLESQPGVQGVRVNLACSSIIIEFDRSQPDVWVGVA